MRHRWLLAVAAVLALTVLRAGANPTRTQSGASTVTTVAVPSDAGDDNTLRPGKIIRVVVTFSEAVDVTGMPRLAIDLDTAKWGTRSTPA